VVTVLGDDPVALLRIGSIELPDSSANPVLIRFQGISRYRRPFFSGLLLRACSRKDFATYTEYIVE
jgi:hypothetical protein